MQLSKDEVKILVASTAALDLVIHHREFIASLHPKDAQGFAMAISIAATTLTPPTDTDSTEQFEAMLMELHDANIAILTKCRNEIGGTAETGLGLANDNAN